MARIEEADVRAIIEYPTAEDDTDVFIETANSLVNDVCLDSEYSDEKLALIEKWLSAHFIAIKHKIRSNQSIGGEVSESFQYAVDLNLNVTIYGQQAMLLDTDGNLANLNQKMSQERYDKYLTGKWMGKDDITGKRLDLKLGRM